MANVLGELFQSIANAIRSKSGVTDTMKPSEFADAISSIMVGSGGSSGGSTGGGTGSLKIRAGKFTINDVSNTKKQTISHGLGVMPDFVLVYANTYGLFDYDNDGNSGSGMDAEDAVTFISKAPLLAAWGMKTEFNSAYTSTYKPLAGDAAAVFSSTSVSAGIDKTSSSSHLIRCPDESTFEVGGTGTSHLFANGEYVWIAIAGMGGGGGANPDANDPVYYVTFMNGDQVLYVRPVVSGDTCPDVKAKGWITTPTKESTEGYTYEYSGWSATNGGSASADVLKNITEDKTVYAAYTATVRKYLITFYDDDGTTVLSTKEVAYGSYPSYTPTKDDVIFAGWVPALAKVTGNASYTASWIASVVTNGLIQASWQTLSQLSADGTAANYLSIGDAKQITLSGTWRGTALNQTYYVFIIGINHNSDLEGTGIQFSGFRYSRTSTTNEPRCLIIDYNKYYYQQNKACIMSASAKNYGGWAASDMRYGVLGSTDIAPSEYGNIATEASVGYDPTPTCATNPVPDTLMSCLPADLRAVMKPITKWTNNVGGTTNVAENITASIDYLPLLSEKEVFGSTKFSSSHEATKQMQYAYYANGGSKIYYAWPSSKAEKVHWWTRSPEKGRASEFTLVYNSGSQASTNGCYSYGVVPVFMV